MTRIDWYILKKFLLTFIFCLLMGTVIAVAVDSSEKMDDFVKANMGFTEALKEYYLGFVPYIWSLLFPLFVFVAVIFFTSKMASRSEVIAILASGTSYNRYLRAYVVGGLLLASLLWLGSRYWIPRANIVRSNFQTKYVDKNDPIKNQTFGSCESCFYLRIDSNTFIGIRSFDSSNKTARGFFLDRIKDNKVIYNLRAESMRWDTATRGWILSNAAERFVDSMGERLTQHAQFNFKLDLKPAELRKDIYIKDKLTTPELTAFIRQEEIRGTEGLDTLRVERYRRTAAPAAVLLLTLMGAIIASRRTRGGSGMHIAIGIVIAVSFILSDRFSTVFATKGNFPPLLAAWLPNIVFAGVAYWLYRKTPK
jgi:lipopolysaccharide export system permease protein